MIFELICDGRISAILQRFSRLFRELFTRRPNRLDLNDIHALAARSKGVKVAISTDAHSVNGFQYMRFGIDQVRRGWLMADDEINTRSLGELRNLLKR